MQSPTPIAHLRRARIPKALRHRLPPRLSLFLLVSQALLIFFLYLSLRTKNALITKLLTSAPASTLPLPPQHPSDRATVHSCWPSFLFSSPSPTPSPAPCNIEHWAYIGEKCFLRHDHVKDRAGHNSSVWSLVNTQQWLYSLDYDFPCPAVVCRHQWYQELNLTSHILLRVLQERYQNETPWNVENMYTGNKYFRINHFWGLEYKFHGQFTLTRIDDDGETVQRNKTAAITIRRGFTQKYCDVSMNDDVPSEAVPIYIVVPYTGRVEQLRLFYLNIKKLLDQDVALRVILATHGGPIHLLGAEELLREMQIGLSEGELDDGHVVQVVEASGDRFGKFSRSKALMDGARYVPADGLMFYCDVDMIIEKDFFHNCRYNAQRNYQVYYPIVYSLYPYGTTVSKEHGYWRKGAFGMVCGYKSDFKQTKSWEHAQNSLHGWGFEDVLLHKEFSDHWKISVFHAVEPNLLHRWHPKYCEFNYHVAACLGTIFQNMGSQSFLASIVAQQGIDVRNIPYTPTPVIFSVYKNDSAGSAERVLEMPAAESVTDLTKAEELRIMYEKALQDGKGGLISLFAKEAQETMQHASLEQTLQAHAKKLVSEAEATTGAPSADSSAGIAVRREASPTQGEALQANIPDQPLVPDEPPTPPKAPRTLNAKRQVST